MEPLGHPFRKPVWVSFYQFYFQLSMDQEENDDQLFFMDSDRKFFWLYLAISVLTLPHFFFGYHFGLKPATKPKSFDWRGKAIKFANRQGRFFFLQLWLKFQTHVKVLTFLQNDFSSHLEKNKYYIMWCIYKIHGQNITNWNKFMRTIKPQAEHILKLPWY